MTYPVGDRPIQHLLDKAAMASGTSQLDRERRTAVSLVCYPYVCGVTTWFTSDHHFSHENIIKYSNRPFTSVAEMDAEMVKRWNAVVGPKDWVWHLGDFTLGNQETADRWFRELNGSVHVLANPWHHDKRWLHKGGYRTRTSSVFENNEPIVVLKSQKFEHPPIVLCHYPLAEWDRKHYGSWHLHGHSHCNFKYPAGSLALDVGVDCHNFYPISLEQVRQMMGEKAMGDGGAGVPDIGRSGTDREFWIN